MCLSVVTEKPKSRSKKLVLAYKLVQKGYIPYIYHPSGTITNKPIIRQKWYKTKKGRILDGVDNPYKLGFHCYTSKEDAIAASHSTHMVVPVLIRGIRTIGIQSNKQVLVADEVYFL